MKNKLYKVYTFEVEGNNKVACLIAGFRGKISGYKNIIKDLNAEGFPVVAYEYSPNVLTLWNPKDLIDLVPEISDDFAFLTASYKEIICLGVSVGAGIGLLFNACSLESSTAFMLLPVYPHLKICLRTRFFFFQRMNLKKMGTTRKNENWLRLTLKFYPITLCRPCVRW